MVDGSRVYFYEALTADRLASRMKAIMALAGVPLDFKPHSARSAGSALLKSKGLPDDDIMDLMRLRSKYIYRKHYKRGARLVATMMHPVAVAAATSPVAADPDVPWHTTTDHHITMGSAGPDPSLDSPAAAGCMQGVLLVSPATLSPSWRASSRPPRRSLDAGSSTPSPTRQSLPASADRTAAAASAAWSSA